MSYTEQLLNGITVLSTENEYLRVQLIPAMGGKIVSIYNKMLRKEFLWKNSALQPAILPRGSDYDLNFFGGMDELIPNDIPEEINHVAYPDHGELWTSVLHHDIDRSGALIMSGMLVLSGLFYSKTVLLSNDSPEIKTTYKIRNESGKKRHFLWKLHAALAVEEGDRLVSSAEKSRIVSPETSRFSFEGEFCWPVIENCDASVVPPFNQTMDFFYLYTIPEGAMHLVGRSNGYRFSLRYDLQIFPFQWYFASFGEFLGHYTVILEPASGMPISVNQAREQRQCLTLEAGQEINTEVSIYAGTY